MTATTPAPDSRHPTPDTRFPTPDTTDRRFRIRRAAIAPLCLCLVAGLHAFRVATCGQTQWKGGGFGMFSTMDSEAARFVRAFAITQGGERPLSIPEHWDKSVAELRAAPTQAKLDALAARLAAMHWRRADEQLVREAQRLTGAIESPAHLPLPPIGLDRSLEAIPTGQPADHAIEVSAVRVECWRLRLDQGSRNATEGVPYSAKLLAEKLREALADIPAEATP
jgi:hypothetical protein